MLPHPAVADFFVMFAGALLSPFIPSADDAAGWWAFNSLAYHEQIRIARDRGEPVTLEAMNAFYPSSPQIERATKHWLAAMDAAKSAALDRDVPLPFVIPKTPFDASEGLTEEQVEAASTYLAARDRVFDEIRLAREAGSIARFPIEFEKSLWGEREYLQGLRGLANDLRLSVELHLAQGDSAGAVDAALSLVATAESLRNEPMIISQLVRSAMVHVAWDATKAILERGQASEAELRPLQLAWQEADFLESIHRSMIGERFLLERLTMDPPPEAKDDGNVMRNRWAKRIDAGMSMAFFRRLIDGTQGDFFRARDAYGDIEVRLENFIGGTPQPVIYLYINTALQLPALQASLYAAGRAQVEAGMAATSLACQRFRLAEGRWPRDLAELSPKYLPEIPVDALGDDRLSYRLEGDDAIVYSFGMNLKDDGGKDHDVHRDHRGEPMEGLDYFSNDMIYRLVPRKQDE